METKHCHYYYCSFGVKWSHWKKMWNQLLYLTCSCSDLLIEKRTIIVLLLIYVTLLLFYCSKLVLPQYQFSRKKRIANDALLMLHLHIHSTKISSNHTIPLPEIAQLRCNVPCLVSNWSSVMCLSRWLA